MDIKDQNELMHTSLDKMIQKHKDNSYVYGRLVHYIEHLLPMALDNSTEIYKQREERRIQLNSNSDEFIVQFLKNNNYFYSSQTELFLKYDSLHFELYNEDDIQYQILRTISCEKYLQDWKYKINKNIIKRIKERSPLSVTPESATIHFVLNTLCPAIFPTRNHAKYFLTIIGECMSSKTDYIFILPPAMKDIMREIGNQCYTYFGLPNIFGQVKYKYYDHKYSDCRLLFIESHSIYGRRKIGIPPEMVKYMIDFLCVASYYAARYGTSDQFLHSCNENKLVEHALFLSTNTHDSIISDFVSKSLTPSVASTIDVKNMIFLWKKYLNERAIPNIIFYETLKNILKDKIKFNEEKDCFVGHTSIFLPIVSQFLRFWEENIIEMSELPLLDSSGGIDIIEYEYSYDIAELCVLFKNWAVNIKIVNEEFILDLIHHFYPDIIIKDQKTIMNIKCNLWNKFTEIKQMYVLFKEKFKHNGFLPDIYSFYCLHHKNKSGLIISKEYFEKTIEQIILHESL